MFKIGDKVKITDKALELRGKSNGGLTLLEKMAKSAENRILTISEIDKDSQDSRCLVIDFEEIVCVYKAEWFELAEPIVECCAFKRRKRFI